MRFVSSAGPFVLSTLVLYFFLLFIMFHPVESIDNFLEVGTYKALLSSDVNFINQSFIFCICNYYVKTESVI